ncbi:MAG: TrmB family transcriptional regulator [Candidatus Neomarinimicrobiota bacterium]
MSNIAEENIIKILSRLDVPGNAAKIYIYLLKNGPSTGYSVSKKSGVNNAVVYRELERLKVQNLVYQLGIKPLKYEAINIDGLLKKLKKQNKSEEKLLENSLKNILKNGKNLISVRIDEYDDLMVEIEKEILSAKEQILIRLWSEEYVLLEKVLRKREGEGLDIQLLSFTPLDNPIGETFSYNIDPHLFAENWQRGIALFVDDERVVVGNKIGKYPIHGMLTNDPLIAESIKDQILLDVELVKSKREMRKKE